MGAALSEIRDALSVFAPPSKRQRVQEKARSEGQLTPCSSVADSRRGSGTRPLRRVRKHG